MDARIISLRNKGLNIHNEIFADDILPQLEGVENDDILNAVWDRGLKFSSNGTGEKFEIDLSEYDYIEYVGALMDNRSYSQAKEQILSRGRELLPIYSRIKVDLADGSSRYCYFTIAYARQRQASAK